MPTIEFAIGQDTVQSGVLSLLHTYLVDHLIPANLGVPLHRSFYARPRIPTDRLKQLQWLDASVRPTVQRLIEEGYEQQVRDIFRLH